MSNAVAIYLSLSSPTPDSNTSHNSSLNSSSNSPHNSSHNSLFNSLFNSPLNSFESDIAIVDVAIQPDLGGRVRYQGSFWQAKSFQGKSILAGTYVKVIGRNNITLLVEDISTSNSH